MKAGKSHIMLGAAILALLSAAPHLALNGSAAWAQDMINSDDEDQAQNEPEDEGQADDGDRDVTNDDLTEAQPDKQDLAQWTDAAENNNERRAEQVDADDYVAKCRDKVACQATLDYVNRKLDQLLQGYGSHSNRDREETAPQAPTARGQSGGKFVTPKGVIETRYHVLKGQRLQLFSGKVGRNDQLLWGQVLKVVPRPQSDQLFSGFSVYRKKSDDLLAFVEGDPDGDKFRMAFNERNHLATDLREQYLTVAHEFMHMIDFDQWVADDGGTDEEAPPQDRSARRVSVKSILEQLLGVEGETDDGETAQTETTTKVTSCSGLRDGEGCYPRGTIFAEFVRKFWTTDDLKRHEDEGFFERNKSRFVTEYATSAPKEDIAESFSYWVIAEGKGKTAADAKQRFFGRFPQLVVLKDHIRRAVIADILKSQAAEK